MIYHTLEEELPRRLHREPINLTDDEKQFIQSVLYDPKMSEERKQRARIVKSLDESQGVELTEKEVADDVGVSQRTVSLVGRRYQREGIEVAVKGKRKGGPRPNSGGPRPNSGGPRENSMAPTLDQAAAEKLAEQYDSGEGSFRELGNRWNVSHETARKAYLRVRRNQQNDRGQTR